MRRVWRILRFVLLGACTLPVLGLVASYTNGELTGHYQEYSAQFGGSNGARFFLYLAIDWGDYWTVGLSAHDFAGPEPREPCTRDVKDSPVFDWWKEHNPFGFLWTAIAWNNGPRPLSGPRRPVLAYDEGRGFTLSVPTSFVVTVCAIGPLIASLGFGIRRLRVRRRRRRGQCLQCGYNLTGNISGVCPEGGTAVTTQQRASHAN